MRPTPPARKPRGGRLVVRALKCAVPASAIAVTAGSALAANAHAQTPVPARASGHWIGFGHRVVLSGTVPAAEDGHRLELQFLPAGTTRWQTLATTTVRSREGYRLAARLHRSGLVQVIDASAAAATASGVIAHASDMSSRPQRINVVAQLHVRPQTFSAVGGRSDVVKGQMSPGLRGRIIRLEGRQSGRWHTLAATSTGSGGRFRLRFAPGAGSEPLRVRFAGDAQAGRSTAPAGTAVSFQQAVASWYNDGGNTACGFHAFYGVANKSLPCGTQVTFNYGGRTVTATVDDRGPYVGGRDFDLNQNTAGALGFGGVGTVNYAF